MRARLTLKALLMVALLGSAGWLAYQHLFANTAEKFEGRWRAVIETPVAEVPVEFEFEVDGETLKGFMTHPTMGVVEIEEGRIEGDKIYFKQHRGRVTFEFEGELDGDHLRIRRRVVLPARQQRQPADDRPTVARRPPRETVLTARRVREDEPPIELDTLQLREPPGRPPLSREEMRRLMAARESKLNPGDIAPDFSLKKLHSDERVQLSSFRGKKLVALVFGSYT